MKSPLRLAINGPASFPLNCQMATHRPRGSTTQWNQSGALRNLSLTLRVQTSAFRKKVFLPLALPGISYHALEPKWCFMEPLFSLSITLRVQITPVQKESFPTIDPPGFSECSMEPKWCLSKPLFSYWLPSIDPPIPDHRLAKRKVHRAAPSETKQSLISYPPGFSYHSWEPTWCFIEPLFSLPITLWLCLVLHIYSLKLIGANIP